MTKQISDMIYRISKIRITVEGVPFDKTEERCTACNQYLYECSDESGWYWCLKCNTNIVKVKKITE